MSLKWDTSDPGAHRSSCGKYCVVRATTDPPNWIAYRLGTTAWKDLGTRSDSEQAKQLCEQTVKGIA